METKYKIEDIIEYPLSENKVDKDYFKEMNTTNFIETKRLKELQINTNYSVDKL